MIVENETVQALRRAGEFTWRNPKKQDWASVRESILPAGVIEDAEARWQRFAPLLAELFPQLRESGGLIESPLRPIPEMEKALGGKGRWLLKMDSHLPVSGSIKARGGFYEVLKFAETLAVEKGGFSTAEDYRLLASEKYRTLFHAHRIAVGSTGNLGLSVGIMGAALGFDVTVHMSADARQWKKDMLRSKGVTVREYKEDYSAAVAAGRKQAESDPCCHFVDDENSRDLFLGYSAAGARLRGQLEALDIHPDREHPLRVYLPCGVGGGPGGVAMGIKMAFGEAAELWFAEPTHCPSMLLGMATGLHHDIAVHDIGLDGMTAADGLACGRPSAFVGKLMDSILDGIFTVEDGRLFRDLKTLAETEGIRLEPSALSGMSGPARCGEQENVTHIIWATGGSMVPPEEMEGYLSRG